MKFAKFVSNLTKFVVFGAVGLVLLLIILLIAADLATQIPAPAPSDMTNRKPFADYIGRDYRVVGNVSALAWNDFPAKDRVFSVSLMSPPLVRNRFVS